MKKTKKVYIGLTADMLHHGHMNILEEARKYGDIIVGLLTDSAIAEYKRLPYLNYKQREKIIINLQGVTEVVPQNEWDYSYNIKKYVLILLYMVMIGNLALIKCLGKMSSKH